MLPLNESDTGEASFVGDGGTFQLMCTAGSRFVLPWYPALEGPNLELAGSGCVRFELLGSRSLSAREITCFANGELQRLEPIAKLTTLPDGEVLNILGDGRLPIEVRLNDPEGECEGECVPAAEVGLDCVTPPK